MKKSRLLKQLRRKIDFPYNYGGLCFQCLFVTDDINDTDTLIDILRKHMPSGRVKGQYWWPRNTYGNVQRWIFVTKLIWYYKLKGE